jgi:TolA-binding protein
MTQTTPLPPGLDPNYVFGELMPLIAIVTIILASAIGLRWLFRSPVGEAIAQRIRESMHPGKRAEADRERSRAEMMEERISQLQDQVGELAERLDFAERMLAMRRERQLGPGE